MILARLLVNLLILSLLDEGYTDSFSTILISIKTDFFHFTFFSENKQSRYVISYPIDMYTVHNGYSDNGGGKGFCTIYHYMQYITNPSSL